MRDIIDKSHIGLKLTTSESHVDRFRVSFFASTIGDNTPAYSDADAAKQQGFEGIAIPLTFLAVLENEDPDNARWLTTMGMGLSRCLHGEQRFDYIEPIYVGDEIVIEGEVVDIIDKKMAPCSWWSLRKNLSKSTAVKWQQSPIPQRFTGSNQ